MRCASVCLGTHSTISIQCDAMAHKLYIYTYVSYKTRVSYGDWELEREKRLGETHARLCMWRVCIWICRSIVQAHVSKHWPNQDILTGHGLRQAAIADWIWPIAVDDRLQCHHFDRRVAHALRVYRRLCVSCSRIFGDRNRLLACGAYTAQ